MHTITNLLPLQKRWTFTPADEMVIEQLQRELNIHPLFCKLLVERGITTFEDARRFFRPEWSQLHDPFLMKDMDKAVKRLSEAIQNQEKVLLYGDYDVDGTTSIALLYSFLEKFHKNLDYYIPDRYKEGYGVSMDGIWYAHEQKVDLIIAMDCGITAIDQVKRANQLGVDVIICDHHLPEVRLPEAVAILNPKQVDCNYPFKELSGCGVAFKLAQAYLQSNGLNEEPLKELTDFLVLSIACDIVPMVDENRVLAWFGLQQLNRTERPGLKALIELSKRERPLTVSDVVFGLGPMINAAGRLADAHQAVRLLLSQEKKVAYEYGHVLEYRNKLRKEFDQRIAKEARELFLNDPLCESRSSIVLYQPQWHKGVVGIVAARMVEEFHRPAIILTESDGKIVGSARSVRGFDVHQAISLCKDLLTTFGGHAHAAGLSMPMVNLPFFQERFEAAVQTLAHDDMKTPEVEVTCEINLNEVTPQFWKILQQFAPFGPDNMNPTFVTRQVQDTGYSRILTGNHLRLSIQQAGSATFTGVAFGRGDDYEHLAFRRPFDVCFNLQENRWQEQVSIQMMVKDLKFGEEDS